MGPVVTAERAANLGRGPQGRGAGGGGRARRLVSLPIVFKRNVEGLVGVPAFGRPGEPGFAKGLGLRRRGCSRAPGCTDNLPERAEPGRTWGAYLLKYLGDCGSPKTLGPRSPARPMSRVLPGRPARPASRARSPRAPRSGSGPLGPASGAAGAGRKWGGGCEGLLLFSCSLSIFNEGVSVSVCALRYFFKAQETFYIGLHSISR